MLGSRLPRIDDDEPGIAAEVLLVARHQPQVVLESCRGKQAVDGGNGAAHFGPEPPPPIGDRVGHCQEPVAEQIVQVALEPHAKPLALAPVVEPLDPVADLPDGQHAQELLLDWQRAEPSDDMSVGSGPRVLRDDVGIEQVAHAPSRPSSNRPPSDVSDCSRSSSMSRPARGECKRKSDRFWVLGLLLSFS